MADKKRKYKVFPWWRAYIMSVLCKFREKYQNPNEILKDYVKSGMTVADIGCGMGYFTLPMADMVGKKGRVVAVDLQLQMLKGLANKAKRQNKLEQIKLMCCSKHSLNISDWKNQMDFILTFAVAHEVPDRERLFKELSQSLKKGGKLLLAEPQGHVSETCFNESIGFAKASGLKVIGKPQINRSRSILFQKI